MGLYCSRDGTGPAGHAGALVGWVINFYLGLACGAKALLCLWSRRRNVVVAGTLHPFLK